MEKIVKTISILLIFVLCIAFSGCAPKVELSSISATGAKSEFAWGEDFSSADLVVTALYNDGSAKVISDYTIDSSAYDKTEAGTYEIKINYENKQTSYFVTVNAPTLTNITVTNAKTEFDWNETFSAGEIVVKAHYSDNSEVVITDYTIDSSEYVKNVAGTYSITVSYNGQSASYDVTVASAPLRGITVSGAKVEFDWGSQFSHEGLIVKARYADNSKVEVEDYEVDSSEFNSQIAGAYVITVRFGGKSATYPVIVKQGKVASIEITSYKEEYTLYEEFNTSNVTGFIVRESGVKEELGTLNATFEVKNREELTLGEFDIVIKSKENESVMHTLRCETVKATSIKILMIGESLAVDTSHYIPNLLKSYGYDFEIGLLYSYDASLGMHYNNLLSQSSVYNFRYYVNGAWNGSYGGGRKNLEYGVTFTDWDVIVIGQQVVSSGVTTSYLCVPDLIDGIKEMATNPLVKFTFNMTWAYKEDATDLNFSKYSNDQMKMYEAITSSAQTIGLPIIPSGTAIQNARTSYINKTLMRNDYCLSYNLGRYVAGLTLFARLTCEDITNVEYKPSALTDEVKNIAIESVKNAIQNPYVVIQSLFKTEPTT